MDLYSAEVKNIQALVKEWLAAPEQEVEATFGKAGQVDATAFLAIAQRLRAKGYESLPQDDRLSVLTPQKIRLSLQGLGVIQRYCQDDTFDGKTFTAMRKDRSSKLSNVDLQEYAVRIKSRRELPLATTQPEVADILKGWSRQQKAFRLIKRWTFKGKGIRIDMSIVRSTAVDKTGEYEWVRTFTEKNIFRRPVQYEVEVELLRDENTDTEAKALQCLVRGIGEILRAIQKNTLLIRKSVQDRVLGAYKALVGSDKFRGVNPVTLEVDNIRPPSEEGMAPKDAEDKTFSIQAGYNVTDKADGLRALGFCDSKGELFLIDLGMNIYRTGLRSPKVADSLVDGEWVTRSAEGKALNHYLIFDMYTAPGKVDVSQLPFAVIEDIKQDSRWNRIQAWGEAWKEGIETVARELTDATRMRVSIKQFSFAVPGPSAVFEACTKVLSMPRIYNTDGLILTPNRSALPAVAGDTFWEQFKWKPAKDNTIDFLATYERDVEVSLADKVTIGIHPDTGANVRFKTMRLYVSAKKDPAYDDPRATVLNEAPLPVRGKKARIPRQPILFNPIDYPDTMASVCYREITIDPETGNEYVTTEDTAEPIPNRCIVECRYDPAAAPGWRWVPMRIRHDKTERLLRGEVLRTMNGERTAMSVWKSIYDPVTLSMIMTGSDTPATDELAVVEKAIDPDIARKYYERKAPKEDLSIVQGLREFHNLWVKDTILYKTILRGGGKKLLDMACGKGGDMRRWADNRVLFVLGVDVAGDNIRGTHDGAYKRYMDNLVRFGRERYPQMLFVIGDSSKRLDNGAAGATPEEADMLRTVFGQSPSGPVPRAVEMRSAGIMREGADAAVLMFAIHYFFKDKETLDGLVENLRANVKVGGYFAGCCFDGQRVFNMLRAVEQGHARVGKEGDVPVWSITKEYTAEDLTADDESVGLAIDVEFLTIGTKHREYLVSFEYLKKRLREVGFELMGDDDLKAVGLRSSTNMFDESYRMAQAAKKNYVMSDVVKEFSFLNRWFIFKRRGEVLVGEDVEADAVAAAAAAATVAATEEAELGTAEGMGAAAAAVAADEALMPAKDRTFPTGMVFYFYPGADVPKSPPVKDVPDANSWLALSAPFPIVERAAGREVTYPTMEHYMAAMRLKHGAGAGTLAESTFSSAGDIHSRFLGKRMGIKGAVDEAKMLLEEITEVRKTLAALLKANRKTNNAEAWAVVMDDYLREGLQQRWEGDAKFRKAVMALKALGKYLLYHAERAGMELGGVRKADGRIDGENKVGLMIMGLAGYRW